jgi:ubiquinone/menaquinone biosynthesis C-methylase UbiE
MSEKSLLQSFYETHHREGKRMGRSMYLNQRAEIFGQWIGSGKKLLDLGGRDGTLTQNFSQGNDITIGDIDENALAIAAERHGFHTKVVNLNERLPFPDGHFDVVIMAEVLEHLPYPRITLAEIARVLKPGGHYIGNIPLSYHLKDRWKVVRGKKLVVASDPTHLQFLKYEEVIKLLSGFFTVEALNVFQGGWKGRLWPRLFARNLAFSCRKG